MESARNCIENFHAEDNGYRNLLIFAAYDREPVVVNAMAAAAKERGLKVDTMWVDPTPVGGSGVLSPMLCGALYSSDCALGIVEMPILFTYHGLKAMRDYGVAYLEIDGAMSTIDCLSGPGARMPLEINYWLERTLDKKLHQAKEIRIKDAKGTDFRSKILDPSYSPATPTPATRPGAFDQFHLGERCFWPQDQSNGVISFDGIYGIGYCWSGKPIKCTIEDGFCTKLEGGPEAERLRKLLEGKGTMIQHKGRTIESTYHIAEIAIGTNPKARLNLRDITMIEAQRNIGVVHIALGNSGGFGPPYNPRYLSKIHLDGTVLDPSVWLDDELIIDKGWSTVLDDPELIEIAKKYGDPKEVIRQERIMYY